MSRLLEHVNNLPENSLRLPNIILPATVMAIVAGLSLVIDREMWIMAIFGLFNIGLTILWLNRNVKRKLIPPLNEMQQNPEQIDHQADKQSTVPTISQAQNLASRQNSSFNRLIIEHTTEIVATLTPEGTILEISPACYPLLGYHPDELVGRSIIQHIHPDDQSALEDVLTTVQNPGNSSTLSYRFHHKDKRYVWLETRFKVDAQAAQAPIIIAVSRDISRHKKIEAEIIQRNRELTILQSAGAAITSSLDLRHVLDTVTHQLVKLFEIESCAILEWNPKVNTLTRIAKYGPHGWWDPRSPAEVHHLANYPLTEWILEEQIAQQMTVSQPNLDPAELNYMQKKQLKTRILLPMIFQREVLGLVEMEDSRTERIFPYQEISLAKLLANQSASAIENARLYEQARQEIAERKRAEEALEQERAMLAQRVAERTADLSKANAELARAARLKDEFLAGMSHELRTPLNAILGSAEILQSGIFGDLSEKQVKYSKTIDESGRHLLAVINDILDLSKIEAGKLDLDIGVVPVKVICNASLRMVKQLAYKKQIKLLHTYDEQITIIQADERRLKQILVNLLSNAIKFTPEGGEVGLKVQGDDDKEIVRFNVWDTGIGIAPEDMDRLFQPFVQLDSRLSRQYEGTGLGLSLVFRMAEMHGGGVTVDSQVDKGSQFIVSLPWIEPKTDKSQVEADMPSQPIPVAWQQIHPTSPPLILLAEDKEENINLFQDYLENAGFRMIVTRNGKEALERAREEIPDIVLMDIQMPEMDGLEAIRHFRADEKLANVPIIALTALAMPGDRERCLAAGANEYLSKPVNLNKLVEKIGTQLSWYLSVK